MLHQLSYPGSWRPQRSYAREQIDRVSVFVFLFVLVVVRIEDLVGVLMTQYMVGMEMPEQDLRALAYQAIID